MSQHVEVAESGLQDVLKSRCVRIGFPHLLDYLRGEFTREGGHRHRSLERHHHLTGAYQPSEVGQRRRLGQKNLSLRNHVAEEGRDFQRSEVACHDDHALAHFEVGFQRRDKKLLGHSGNDDKDQTDAVQRFFQICSNQVRDGNAVD